MDIILLQDVPGLGKFGNIVTVKAGYARNYLIPYGKSLLSNSKNIDIFNQKKHTLIKKDVLNIAKSQNRIMKMKRFLPIQIFSKASDKGKLFGSISVKDIFKVIIKLGIKIEKHEITMKNSIIRKIGNYSIIFQPHKEVSCYVLIQILPK
ncbi:50S ribosomal protein L9 [Buchnera aphidicola]|uniref:50S ribosomal protein L9 n=1 Tax=Buchnera aphidicola TaxID=9 RepID=UPI003463A98C